MSQTVALTLQAETAWELRDHLLSLSFFLILALVLQAQVRWAQWACWVNERRLKMELQAYQELVTMTCSSGEFQAVVVDL